MASNPEEPPPWARRCDESARAYAAFLTYRDAGPARSLDAVATLLSRQRSGSKRAVPGCLGKWSVAHEWVDRARAWDAHEQAARDRAAVAAIEAEAALWTDRERRQRERIFQAGERLIGHAEAILRHPLTRQSVEKDSGGKIVAVVVEPARWSLRDAAMFMRMGLDMTNQAIAGMSPSGAKDGGGESTDGMSPEAVEIARRAVAEAMGGRDEED